MAMEPILFEAKLFARPEERDISQEGLLWFMTALGEWNRLWLSANPDAPSLYESSVTYFFDPNESDPWQDIPTTIEKGYGDCEDLACWRIGELRAQGIMARPYIRWRKKEGRWIYHALLCWPDGRIEDPSLALGMRGPILRKPVFIGRVA